MAIPYVLRTRKEELGLEDINAWQSSSETLRFEKIDLPSKKITDDGANIISSLVLRCQRLQTLKLDRNEIGDVGAKSLGLALLASEGSLTHLDLSWNRISACGAEDLATGLFRQRAPTEAAATASEALTCNRQDLGERVLDLSHNSLKQQGVEAIVAAIACHFKGSSVAKLRLRLRGVECTNRGLEFILGAKESLVELDVGENPISVVGINRVCHEICCSNLQWQALGLDHLEAIDHNRHLHEQDRAGRLDTPLAKCVQSAAQLRELNCGGNAIGDQGAASLVAALTESDPHTLERLAMGESGCGIKAAMALEKALRKRAATGRGEFTGLRVLELPSNSLTDECVAVLAEGLAESLTLQRLTLADNQITCRGAIDLAKALERQRTNPDPGCLVELVLDKNRVGDDGAAELAASAMACVHEIGAMMFQVPWGLERLHLAETQVGPRGLGHLRGAVTSRMVLAQEAATYLRTSKDESVRQRCKRVRMPAGLDVIGQSLDDADTVKEVLRMRMDAETELRERWPEPAIPADEAAGASLPTTPRHRSKALVGVGRADAGRLRDDRGVAPAEGSLSSQSLAVSEVLPPTDGTGVGSAGVGTGVGSRSLGDGALAEDDGVGLPVSGAFRPAHGWGGGQGEGDGAAGGVKSLEQADLPTRPRSEDQDALGDLRLQDQDRHATRGSRSPRHRAQAAIQECDPASSSSGVAVGGSSSSTSPAGGGGTADLGAGPGPLRFTSSLGDGAFEVEGFEKLAASLSIGPSKALGELQRTMADLDLRQKKRGPPSLGRHPAEGGADEDSPLPPVCQGGVDDQFRGLRDGLLGVETEPSRCDAELLCREAEAREAALKLELRAAKAELLQRKLAESEATAAAAGEPSIVPSPAAPGADDGFATPLVRGKPLDTPPFPGAVRLLPVMPSPSLARAAALPNREAGTEDGSAGATTAGPSQPSPSKAKGGAKGSPPPPPKKGGKGPPLPHAKESPEGDKAPAPAAPAGKGKAPAAPPKGAPKGGAPKGGPPLPGKGPPPAKGKGGGPKSASAKPEAKSKSSAASGPKHFGETPFGKRIHWVQPTYDAPGGESVFGELRHGLELDSELLKAMFTEEDPDRKRFAGGRRKTIARKPAGIAILDPTRAQNMAIVLSKLRCSSEELCACLRDLDFTDPHLDIDDVELLSTVLPTGDEAKKLLDAKNAIDQLRDIEQKVMPFVLLPRAVIKLKLMKCAMAHRSVYEGFKFRCLRCKKAAIEVKASPDFRQVLGVCLQVGNFINHGVGDTREGTVRGFAIESLSMLATFKMGAVSTLHFLSLTMDKLCRAQQFDVPYGEDWKTTLERLLLEHSIALPAFGTTVRGKSGIDYDLSLILNPEHEGHVPGAEEFPLRVMKDARAALRESLAHVPDAAKDKIAMLKAGIETFAKDADFVQREAEHLEAGAEGKERLEKLAEEMKKERDLLKCELEQTTQQCTEVQKFFSISSNAALPPIEQFFGHIANFLDLLLVAWQDIEKNPARWKQYEERKEEQMQQKQSQRRLTLPAKLLGDEVPPSAAAPAESAEGATTAKPPIPPERCATAKASAAKRLPRAAIKRSGSFAFTAGTEETSGARCQPQIFPLYNPVAVDAKPALAARDPQPQLVQAAPPLASPDAEPIGARPRASSGLSEASTATNSDFDHEDSAPKAPPALTPDTGGATGSGARAANEVEEHFEVNRATSDSALEVARAVFAACQQSPKDHLVSSDGVSWREAFLAQDGKAFSMPAASWKGLEPLNLMASESMVQAFRRREREHSPFEVSMGLHLPRSLAGAEAALAGAGSTAPTVPAAGAQAGDAPPDPPALLRTVSDCTEYSKPGSGSKGKGKAKGSPLPPPPPPKGKSKGEKGDKPQAALLAKAVPLCPAEEGGGTSLLGAQPRPASVSVTATAAAAAAAAAAASATAPRSSPRVYQTSLTKLGAQQEHLEAEAAAAGVQLLAGLLSPGEARAALDQLRESPPEICGTPSVQHFSLCDDSDGSGGVDDDGGVQESVERRNLTERFSLCVDSDAEAEEGAGRAAGVHPFTAVDPLERSLLGPGTIDAQFVPFADASIEEVYSFGTGGAASSLESSPAKSAGDRGERPRNFICHYSGDGSEASCSPSMDKQSEATDAIHERSGETGACSEMGSLPRVCRTLLYDEMSTALPAESPRAHASAQACVSIVRFCEDSDGSSRHAATSEGSGIGDAFFSLGFEAVQPPLTEEEDAAGKHGDLEDLYRFDAAALEQDALEREIGIFRAPRCDISTPEAAEPRRDSQDGVLATGISPLVSDGVEAFLSRVSSDSDSDL